MSGDRDRERTHNGIIVETNYLSSFDGVMSGVEVEA